MSDYLTHLVARALAPAPIVRPRLASFFEPPPTSGVLNAGRVFGSETNEEATVNQDRVQDFEAAASSQSMPAKAEPGGRPTSVELASASASSVHSAQISSIADNHGKSGEPRPASPAPRSSRREEAHSPSEQDQDRQPSVPTVFPSRTISAPVPVSTVSKQSDLTPHSRPEQSPPPLLVPPRRNGRPPDPPRNVRSPRAPVDSPMQKEYAPTLPQAIHVTIGRLEIRAVTPPAAQPRPQSSRGSVVSLEDYLRQRSRGGGR